jgi:hypothetical protein
MVLNLLPDLDHYIAQENRDAINRLAAQSHAASLSAGWWPTNAEGEASLENQLLVPTKLCLIHSEISEAMEGHRKDLPDDKLPHRKMIEVELADALHRIFDLAGAMKLDLGGAWVEKMAYNAKRADHRPEARSAANGKAY